MTDKPAESPETSRLRYDALSQWDGEGGAGPFGPQETASDNVASPILPAMGPAELVQLRVRVIALENSVIAMLADSSGAQMKRVSGMAAFISPNPGFAPHPLTLQAAARMTDLVERARPFQGFISLED